MQRGVRVGRQMAARTMENNGNDDGEEKIFTVGGLLELIGLDDEKTR